ncbi:MAG: leishmanolysin-related zinc metalloendopeptidase [Longimicrobiales bacterium]
MAGNDVSSAPAVLVKDGRGRPLSGVPVRFRVMQGGGVVQHADAITDTQGGASAGQWTLGPLPGPNEVEARVGQLPGVRFTAIGLAQALPPPPPPVPTSGDYHIAVRYLVTASLRQQEAVVKAIGRWQTVIRRDLADIPVNAAAAACFPAQPALGEVVDDLLVLIEFVNIDGAGRTLGEAGPCYVRADNTLPIVGHLKLDVADLQQMEATGTLDDVVLHEIGHVLGIGTIWTDRNLVVNAGGADPGYSGANAVGAYHSLGGTSGNVPVENTGGTGTRDAHWREAVFRDELMTGWIGSAANPLSVLTIESLNDLGYGASPGAASGYVLGSAAGLSATKVDLHGREQVKRPRWRVDRRGRRLSD